MSWSTYKQDLSGARLDSLDEAFFVLDRNLNLMTLNSAFAKTLNRPAQDLIGQPYLSVLPHAIDSISYREFQCRLKDGKKGVVEDFCISRGTWFEFRISECKQGIAVLAFDITQRKLAEQSRKSNESRAQSMVENASVGLARLGLDGRWLQANALCSAITGFTWPELKQLFWSDLCPTEDRSELAVKFVDLIAGRSTSIDIEQRIIRSNGFEIWVQVNISLVRSAIGHPLFFTAIFFDISDRKASHSSLQFALQASQMGEWDFDAMEDSTRRSLRFNQIYGYDKAPSNWTFKDFIMRTHPDDREKIKSTFKESIDKGSNLNLEIRILHPSGIERWVSLRAQVYMNQLGRTVRMAGLLKDITESKLAGLELQTAKLAAEDANREKSYFLANMSHEIRTPLGAILGFTDALREEHLNAEDRLHYLDVVQRNGCALASLIDDILDLSKVESGHLEVEKSTTNIPELISEVCSLLQVKADAKSLNLDVIHKGNSPTWIATDRIRLRQILINIVGNALKFTNAGRVAVEVIRERSVTNDLLVIRITDTGPGIGLGESQRLFQPFMQADNSTSRQFGGTGLGLALSRRLARAMGGDLTLESSELGVGSVFRVHLPAVEVDGLQKSAVQPAPPDPAHERSSIDGVRVLLAEDCIDNQELIKHLLDKVGTQTSLVEDGKAAVQRALNEEFDVVLMDMQMPGLDGYEATRRLRDAGFTRPIIALTANAMRHDRERCLNAGCTDYLSKPINPDTLYRLISNSMPQLHT